MTNVTYLFGAGASNGVLPVVNQFQKEIHILNGKLRTFADLPIGQTTYKAFLKEGVEYTLSMALHELINEFEWLKEKCNSSLTVDTYAKKLTITGQKRELRKLKVALSFFLSFLEASKGVDNRYDHFFASILNGSMIPIGSGIRILSWNYDSQFEISFSDFCQNKDVKAIRSNLGLIHKYASDKWIHDTTFLFKINGSTSELQKGISGYEVRPLWADLPDYGNEAFLEKDNLLTEEALKSIVRRFLQMKNMQLDSGLSFAWEGEDLNGFGKTIVEACIEGTSETDILVVIGYSFPFFNRVIDRQILGSMKKLRKIYIQDPRSHEIIQRLDSIFPGINSEVKGVPKIEIVPITDTSAFYIPNEI